MKRFLSIIICITLTLTLCSCGRGLKRFEKSFLDVFDTASNIVAYADSSESFNAGYEEIHGELVRLNNLFDIYESHEGVTSLKDVNEKAALSPVEIDPTLFDLLEFGVKMYGETDGAVNICMGAVLSIWHEYREEGKALPDTAELKKAAAHCDVNNMVLDKESCTVFFKDNKMSVDVGAIAKGYAAQRITDEYADCFSQGGMLLNLGGNIAVTGAKPDGSQWNVQIENPRGGEAVDTLTLTNNSVVTSGDYQRYYEVDGKRYCHIIDPETLFPADNFASVTVICSDSAVADALSTALFILPQEKAKSILKKYDNAKAVYVDKRGIISRI